MNTPERPPHSPGVLNAVWSNLKSLLHLSPGQGQAAGQAPAPHARSVRLACDVPVVCEASGQTFDGRLLDVSTGGLRLGCPHPLEKGQELTVHPEGQPVVEIRIVWSRSIGNTFQAGAVYREGMLPQGSWVEALFLALHGAGDHAADDRRHTRRQCHTPARIRKADGAEDETLDGVILNLGFGGCLFESGVDWPVDTRIVVTVGPLAKLKPLPLPGRVAHCSPASAAERWQAGVEFDALEDKPKDRLGRYIAFLAAYAGETPPES